MAYIFGDSFDCYATLNDPIAGYWDSGTIGSQTLTTGRFAGSQCLKSGGVAAYLTKSSGVNDAVHHIVCAFQQTATLTGTTLGMYLQLSDAATNQVCIVFRSDGVILLTSATPIGTVLATYSGAVTAANTWFAFEFEVVINNATGRFRARKNGNTSDDFDSGATLNTRPGTNAYANKLTLGQNVAVNNQLIDDLLWRSDASSVPWVGDVRCYTRMPASDASVQFTRSLAGNTQSYAPSTISSIVNTTVRFTPYTMTFDGAISSAVIVTGSTAAGNMKCAIYANAAGAPTTVLQSAVAPVATAVAGNNTFTFTPPLAVTKGQVIWLAMLNDTSIGTWSVGAGTAGVSAVSSYAAFPQANPGVTTGINPITSSIIYTTSVNAGMVNETLQDGTTTYVYDSTVGHADLYNIASIAATPASTVAVITRAFAEKLDAGFRQVTVQVKSGATTVQATPQALSNAFGWIYRADTVDPATGAAWTPAAVNALQVGPLITG